MCQVFDLVEELANGLARFQAAASDAQCEQSAPVLSRSSSGRSAVGVQFLGAAAALCSASIHLGQWLSSQRREPMTVGTLVVVFVGALAAVVAASWRHWLTGMVLLLYGGITLSTVLIASNLALSGVDVHWTDPLVWASTTAELICVWVGVSLVLKFLRD